MTFAVVILSFLLACSIYINVVSLRRNLELSDQRERLVDVIEESLDVLDACHIRLAHTAEIPVLSDEPLIRDVVLDIKRARNAVLAIASKVVVYGDDDTE